MSHKKITSVCFVIDASIARAAGPPESQHPTGALCREFLQTIRGVCHRIAWNASIKAEWDEHGSKFATAWLVSMVNLRKRRPVPDEVNEEFREIISRHSTDAGTVAVVLKDAHLIEAAWASDCRIAALDETVRAHFCRICAACSELQRIQWANPVAEGKACIEWVEAGALDEAARFLRPPATG
jgi:hypothetical protein